MDNSTQATPTFPYQMILFIFYGMVFSFVGDWIWNGNKDLFPGIYAKWVIFWGIGLRYIISGFYFVYDPFQIGKESRSGHDAIARLAKDLGWAEVCIGLLGVVSLFEPGIRWVAGMVGGLLSGITGARHFTLDTLSKKDRLWTYINIVVFILVIIYLIDLSLT